MDKDIKLDKLVLYAIFIDDRDDSIHAQYRIEGYKKIIQEVFYND